MTYQSETHLFAVTHTDRHGRQTEGTHSEAINVNATHLVLIPMEDTPIFAIRAFSLTEAFDIATSHHVTDYAIWERLPNRSFAPMVS